MAKTLNVLFVGSETLLPSIEGVIKKMISPKMFALQAVRVLDVGTILEKMVAMKKNGRWPWDLHDVYSYQDAATLGALEQNPLSHIAIAVTQSPKDMGAGMPSHYCTRVTVRDAMRGEKPLWDYRDTRPYIGEYLEPYRGASGVTEGQATRCLLIGLRGAFAGWLARVERTGGMARKLAA